VRLGVSRETVRELTGVEAQGAAGGATTSAICPGLWSQAQPQFCLLTPVCTL
jgi:hypothetical protein